MCGILGLLCVGDTAMTDAAVARARDVMSHRGPDDAGLASFDLGSARLWLAQRRLSILDLSPAGHQPMSDAAGRRCVIFNGEIFNYRELRDELASAGHAFRTGTDTEVIPAAVDHWGLEGALARFRGMYAFALYDRADHTLTLVRDPLGVKPLYYWEERGNFAFASEIKAILALGLAKPHLDRAALWHYLTFAAAPAPYTMFARIRKLEAGHCLKVSASGRISKSRYWNPAVAGKVPWPWQEHEATDELQRLLRQAVARRMVSDVPFGVFLSGGVDSSLNVALMAEQMDRPVRTFSVGIENDPTNEFQFAREVAARFGADHHEIVIGDDHFLEALPKIAWHQDEPLADPVCVPLYHVSKLARDSGVPVIQVGEGSDELFSGYLTHRQFADWESRYWKPWLRLPPAIRAAAARVLGPIVPAVLRDALERAALDEELFIGNAIAFWDCEKRRLVRDPPPVERSAALATRYARSGAREGVLDRLLALELANRLPELLLMRVDKMSMAHAIETRVPFLDEDVARFALALPASLKIRDGTGKYILKKVAERYLPPEIIYRKKMGFCGSATNMLRPRLAAFARETILDAPVMGELFNRVEIEKLFRRHAHSARFHSFKIWNLMNLALWHNAWFRADTAAPARSAQRA